MSIEIVWDDPQHTILRYDIGSGWTWEELDRARLQVFELIDEAEHDVIYTIAHFTQGKLDIPPGMMKHFSALTDRSHPKAGLMVIVGVGRGTKRVFGGLRRLFVTTTGRPLDFSYADSLEEARRLIDRERSR